MQRSMDVSTPLIGRVVESSVVNIAVSIDPT